MKILYTSQYFPPEMGAPAARVAELSQHWVRNGHEVTVLTGFPNHPTGIVPAEYRRRLRHLVFRETVNHVDVVRAWLLPFSNGRSYERMLSYSSFALSAAVTGLLLSRPEAVIATSPQLLVGLAGWWLARCKRVPFVLEVRDLWPESLAAVGVGTTDTLLYRSLSRVAGFLYRNADHIVVVSSAFKTYLARHWNVPLAKISVIENGVETDMFAPSNVGMGVRRNLGLENKFVVCYIGTIGLAHGLDTLVDAAALLQNKMPNTAFLVVGEGAEKKRILSLANARGLHNMRFVPQQPRTEIPAYIAAADVCTVLLKDAELFKTVIPSKLLEFMSCARPVILGVDGQARQILQDANAGIFVPPEDPVCLAEAIVRIAASQTYKEELGRNGRRHVIKHFSRARLAAQYIDVLQRLLGHAAQRRVAAA